MKKILAIVGSFREDSYNQKLADIARELIGDRAEFKFLDFKNLPYMNEDIEFPTPEEVKRVREEVKEADGLWFFTPEYNRFFPGLLKNLIDWLSRPEAPDKGNVLNQKAVAISGVSPGMSGTLLVQHHLVSLLSFLNMRVMNAPRLTIANVGEKVNDEGKMILGDSQEYLEKEISAFLEFI